MKISKRLLSFFVALSLFFTQTAQAYSSLSWQSQSGSGHYNETVKLANIKSDKGLNADATGGIVVDIPEVASAAPAPAPSGLIAAPVKAPLTDKQAAQAEADKKVQDAQRLKDHLDTLAKQPGQVWLGQLAKDPKLNLQFKQVSAAAQQWNYSHDGLTPEAAGVIVIAVTYFTAGAASGAAGAITGAAAGTTTIAPAALAAGMTTLASQASLALINNKGDLGKTLDDLGKSENVKALVTAMVTAGALQGVSGTDFMQAHQGLGFSDTALRNLTNAAVRTSMNVAINGGSLQDQLGATLQNALVDTLSAQGEHALHLSPEQAQQLNAQITSKLGHALLGCATAGAKHQDCASGALGDVTGEVVGELLLNGRDPLFLTPKEKQDIKDKTKVLAAVVGFSAGLNPDTAAAAGLNAVENNALFVDAVRQAATRSKEFLANKTGEAVQKLGKLMDKLQIQKLEEGKQSVADYLNAAAASGGLSDTEVAALAMLYAANEALFPTGALDVLPGAGKAVTSAGKLVKTGVKAEEAVAELRRAESALHRADGLPIEQVKAGSKGEWDAAINGKLKPETAYQLDNGHVYVTDAGGRVKAVEGELDLTKMDRNTYQQCAAGKCGNAGDEGGHLIASSLGGAGDKINIVPQSATLNRGDWKAMENELRGELQAGKQVSVKIEVGYPAGEGARPDSFLVVATINGKPKPFEFHQ